MLTVRPARQDDARAIVALVRAGFDKKRLGATIYGCKGMNSYIRQQMSVPDGLSDTVYIVGESRGSTFGCVEFKFLQDTIFLNYICVSHYHRQKGLGRELLRKALIIAKKDVRSKISLDVFCDNTAAISWYEKLGFKTDYYNNWWNIALPKTNKSPKGIISAYGQANVCQRAFGFSQFGLTTGKNTYSIGRLGSAWFRVTQSEVLSDKEALTCLHVLDAKRKLLGIFPEDSKLRNPRMADMFCRSARMTMRLDKLLRSLSD